MNFPFRYYVQLNVVLIFTCLMLTTNFAIAAKKTEKITKHQEIITLPHQRKVSIQIISIDKSPQFPLDLMGFSKVIIKDSRNNLLGSFKLDSPNVGFKIYTVQGMPTPLILFAKIDSIGASEGFYSVYPYTIVNNQLKLLHQPNKNEWNSSTYLSGFYIGKLPNNGGLGAIWWTYTYENNESRDDFHRYSINIYKWDGKMFFLSKSLRTKDKYSDDKNALKAYGFDVPDLSLDFSNISATR
ncbi:MAG: hypothetical protein ACD_46C00113G0010 [uncultured bacterium]|nr:MAG: hypothetical protein ACD_46C00113G0010 [uncultured bacterium]